MVPAGKVKVPLLALKKRVPPEPPPALGATEISEYLAKVIPPLPTLVTAMVPPLPPTPLPPLAVSVPLTPLLLAPEIKNTLLELLTIFIWPPEPFTPPLAERLSFTNNVPAVDTPLVKLIVPPLPLLVPTSMTVPDLTSKF